jgi:putative intracellular protease/amidase
MSEAHVDEQTNEASAQELKVLVVLSSHNKLGSTGRDTGWYLPEAAHPWHILRAAGIGVDFVSPLGGRNRMDGHDESDPIQTEFLSVFGPTGPDTMVPSQVDPKRYAGVLYVGGHGTMWDFADDEAIALLSANIYEGGGVISAVCHGPAGLVNIKLSDGSFLVAGKKIAAFTDSEEEAVGLTDIVPYLLESTLRDRGGLLQVAPNFTENVIVDGRLVTGQNPASATGVGNKLAQLVVQNAARR